MRYLIHGGETMQFRSVILCIIFALMSSICTASELPYRKDYPDVKIVETEDLKKGYDNNTFVIVDVRSSIEYNVIRVKGAYHIKLSETGFLKKLQSLAAQNPSKKIAVYCNGGTCLKSYKSAMVASEAGMDNVYAFDAGIPVWSNSYPLETLLLGKELIDPKKQLIPKSELKKVTLELEAFKQKAEESSSVVIDTRDLIQRTEKLHGFENALPIPFDKLIKNVIGKGNMKNKHLLIFDQVGKQVRWLMYYLVDAGYSFNFLEGGATAILKNQDYRLLTITKK